VIRNDGDLEISEPEEEITINPLCHFNSKKRRLHS
jgi:hypothetical protein